MPKIRYSNIVSEVQLNFRLMLIPIIFKYQVQMKCLKQAFNLKHNGIRFDLTRHLERESQTNKYQFEHALCRALNLTIIIGIREDPGLWSKGFAKKSIVQIVAGTVRRSVGIHRITSRRIQTKWFCGLSEGPSGPWISRH